MLCKSISVGNNSFNRHQSTEENETLMSLGEAVMHKQPMATVESLLDRKQRLLQLKNRFESLNARPKSEAAYNTSEYIVSLKSKKLVEEESMQEDIDEKTLPTIEPKPIEFINQIQTSLDVSSSTMDEKKAGINSEDDVLFEDAVDENFSKFSSSWTLKETPPRSSVRSSSTNFLAKSQRVSPLNIFKSGSSKVREHRDILLSLKTLLKEKGQLLKKLYSMEKTYGSTMAVKEEEIRKLYSLNDRLAQDFMAHTVSLAQQDITSMVNLREVCAQLNQSIFVLSKIYR
jgi:hypothetical protein